MVRSGRPAGEAGTGPGWHGSYPQGPPAAARPRRGRYPDR